MQIMSLPIIEGLAEKIRVTEIVRGLNQDQPFFPYYTEILMAVVT